MENIYQSPEYLAFMEDICLNPQDDGIRLILADWLYDRGEKDRAEFIRIQIELAKPVHLPNEEGFHQTPYATGNLLARLRSLLQKTPRNAWLPSYGYHPASGFYTQEKNATVTVSVSFHINFDAYTLYSFNRGFINIVDMNYGGWEKIGQQFCLEQPVERIYIRGKEPLNMSWNNPETHPPLHPHEWNACLPYAWYLLLLKELSKDLVGSSRVVCSSKEKALEKLYEVALKWAKIPLEKKRVIQE